MKKSNWSSEEIQTLAENYNSVTNERLQELIPGKSWQGIYKKAYKMGLRKTAEMEAQNRSNARKREKGSNWHGGTKKTTKGYIQVLCPDHPRADSCGYVMEHILVWEQKTGVSVPTNCVIHHLNKVKTDNRIENLCMMERGAHTTYHHTGTHQSEKTKKKISEIRREKKC